MTPEFIRPGADLQDTRIAEGLDDIADGQKALDPLIKGLVLQIAVGQIAKGYSKSAQYLACGKEAALAVPQANAILIRALIPGTPEKNRNLHASGQPGHLELRPKIAMWKENPIDMLSLEFLLNPNAVSVIMQKTVSRNIINIDEIHPHSP